MYINLPCTVQGSWYDRNFVILLRLCFLGWKADFAVVRDFVLKNWNESISVRFANDNGCDEL